MKNYVKMACALAAVLCAWTVSAAEVRQNAETVTNEFRIAYAVTFPEGTQPMSRIQCLIGGRPGMKEKEWGTCRIDVSFKGNTRVFGPVTGAYTGLPWMSEGFMDLPAPKPGEKRRVEIVHQGDYLSVYQEVDGQMYLFNRTGIARNIRLYGVAFPEGFGEVADVKLSVADEPYDVEPKELTVPLPNVGKIARFAFCPGQYPVDFAMTFPDGSKKPPSLRFCSFRQVFNEKVEEKEEYIDNGVPAFRKTKSIKRRTLDDSGLELRLGYGQGRRVYTYARLPGRYRNDQFAGILADPDRYGEPASKHTFQCAIRQDRGGYALWVDNSYLTRLPVTNGCEALQLRLPSFGRAERLPDETENVDSMRVDLSVPQPFDTSRCHVDLGSFSLECNGYLSREPGDALPDSFLRRVPADTYLGAIVRCRVDGASSNSCELTARLTNFHAPSTGGRSPEAIAQHTLHLPRTNGEYQVRFNFDAGRIQDLIHDLGYDYLDFELLGGVDVGGSTWSQNCWEPSKKPSGVTVQGVTLLRSPASLRVTNGAYRNLYVEGETASVTARVTAVRAGEYGLRWRVSDVDGKLCEDGRKTLSLAAGETVELPLVFETRDIGWYRLKVDLIGAEGYPLVRFPDGAFVVVAKDDRRAGYESPYFTWSGIGLADTNEFRREGAFLKKVGIRRTQLKKWTEEDAKEYGLTLGEAPWFDGRGATLEERQADYERQVREVMRKWPHLSSALIFHENAGGPEPQELVGGEMKEDAAELQEQKRLADEAAWHARIWRKVAPQVELKLGNSGSSRGIMRRLFRAGYPKELIDTMGEETVGQSSPPEVAVGQNFRMLKDLAEFYGYTNSVSACYEWKTRVRRDFFGNLRKHAAWYVRDCLIGLAWGAKQVEVPSGPEIGNSYYNTCWGGGALTRAPLCQPFPVLAAVANLTRVLDRCTFSRLVPTGSETVYLVEYRNPDGRYVYAGWTPRGAVEAKFTTKAKNITITDLFGRARGINVGNFTSPLSEEPTFLTLDAPIDAADATGPRSYVWEEHPGFDKRKILSPFDSAAGVSLAPQKEQRFNAGRSSLQWLRPGAFDVGERQEDGRTCLAVTLRKDTPSKPVVGEYGMLRLTEPIPVPEDATTIGVEVRGNSSWGKIVFEVEDAKGKRWSAVGPGTDYYDMSCTMALDFDGWHALQFMIRPESPAKVASIGKNMKQWLWWKPEQPMTYPVKIVGVGFILRRWGLGLLNWYEPATDTILLRNLFAY